MFETGLWADPRGAYAILALLVLAVLGAALAPGGLRSRSRSTRRLVAGAVLVGAALSLLWPQLNKPAAFQVLSPLDSARIVGAWADGSDTLTVEANGGYRCSGTRCTGVGTRGTWSVDGDTTLVTRWSDGHEVPWTVVAYHGHQRLALMPLVTSGSGWEGRLVFQRVGE